MARRALSSIRVEMSVATIENRYPPTRSAYALSTIARLYGSSPLEHPALHTSSGRATPAASDGNATRVRNSKCAGSRKKSVLLVVIMSIMAGSSSAAPRSEEHTSELQSHVNLVCRLLLEKKK